MCKASCDCKILIKYVVDLEYFEFRKNVMIQNNCLVFFPNFYSIFFVFFLQLIQQFTKLLVNATVLVKYLRVNIYLDMSELNTFPMANIQLKSMPSGFYSINTTVISFLFKEHSYCTT